MAGNMPPEHDMCPRCDGLRDCCCDDDDDTDLVIYPSKHINIPEIRKVGKGECPYGYIFTKDWDRYDACFVCPEWENCDS